MQEDDKVVVIEKGHDLYGMVCVIKGFTRWGLFGLKKLYYITPADENFGNVKEWFAFRSELKRWRV